MGGIHCSCYKSPLTLWQSTIPPPVQWSLLSPPPSLCLTSASALQPLQQSSPRSLRHCRTKFRLSPLSALLPSLLPSRSWRQLQLRTKIPWLPHLERQRVNHLGHFGHLEVNHLGHFDKIA